MIRRLDGLLQGDYRTLFRGVGIDFADLREYEPGDDVRHIDWNVTARMDDAVRAPVHRGPRADRLAAARPLAVDGLRARRPAPRSACCIELAATLAQLLTRGGNRVGAILYDNDVRADHPAAAAAQPGAAP